VANTLECCYKCFLDQYKQDKKKALNKEKSYTIWLLDRSSWIRKPESIIEFKMITNDETKFDECHFTITTNMSHDQAKPNWVENIQCKFLNDTQKDFTVTLNVKDLKSTKDLKLPTFENGTVSVNERIDVFRFAAIYFTQHFTETSGHHYHNIVYKMDPIKPSIVELLLVSILKKKKIYPGDGISNFVCGEDLKDIYKTSLASYEHRPEPARRQAWLG